MTVWCGAMTPGAEKVGRRDAYGAPSPCIRRVFTVDGEVKRAELRMSALGIFVPHVNGLRVSNEVFAPGWTDTHYSASYSHYDVTALLHEGENILGAELGDGWYASNLSDVGKFVFGDYPLKLWYRLVIRYRDGRTANLRVDGSERAGTGEVLASDNQNGEIVDKRLYRGDFTAADFDASDFVPVELFELPVCPRKAVAEPIVEHEPLAGKLLFDDGTRAVYDFGQNFAGVVRCGMRGTRGEEVRVRYAEVLDARGELYVANLRSALATDVVTLSGRDDVFEPLFTYHGFRYAEFTRAEGAELSDVVGVPFYTDLRETGEFSCADEWIDRFFSCVRWGMRSNFMSVPTDCPQRDERLGWTGDAQLFCDAAMYLADCSRFFDKYLRDMEDSLKDGKGTIPVVVPYPFDYVPYDRLHIGYTGYSECAIIIAYRHYLMYGDRAILVRCLPMMKQHLRYMERLAPEGIPYGCDTHGDWLSVCETTDRDAFSTLYYGYAADLVARICAILGDVDETHYRELYFRVRAAFRDRFLHSDGRIESDTQTAYILALEFGFLAPEEARPHLERKFAEHRNHLVSGFMGAKFALSALCRAGLEEIAFALLKNDDYPSWGYPVRNGATTIYERWDGCKDGAFNLDPMNSFNHNVFGSAAVWLFDGLLGIRPVESAPGFQSVLIRPYPSREIGDASAAYDSVRGRIESSYRVTDEGFDFSVTLPNGMEPIFDFGREILSRSVLRTVRRTTYRFLLSFSKRKS